MIFREQGGDEFLNFLFIRLILRIKYLLQILHSTTGNTVVSSIKASSLGCMPIERVVDILGEIMCARPVNAGGRFPYPALIK